MQAPRADAADDAEGANVTRVGDRGGDGERPSTDSPKTAYSSRPRLAARAAVSRPSPRRLGSVLDVDPPYPGRFTEISLTPAATAAS